MEQLKRFFVKLWYSLPFAMKGGDDAIKGETVSIGEGTYIGQEVKDQRVSKHLLKGEVTQEVEELRYRTYKVDNEAKKYDYVGNGVVIKREEKKREVGKFKFSQDNDAKEMSVSETLGYVNDYMPTNVDRRIDITYSDIVKFKLERFMTRIDVDINEKENKIETTLHFSAIPDPYNVNSKAFIHYLESIEGVSSERQLLNIDLITSLLTLSFSTYKANNEEDFVNYSFVDGASFKRIERTKHEFLLTFEWKSYIRLKKDLESMYYSKEMDEKYKTHARKEVAVPIANLERKKYCSICGAEIHDDNIGMCDDATSICICKDCVHGI